VLGALRGCQRRLRAVSARIPPVSDERDAVKERIPPSSAGSEASSAESPAISEENPPAREDIPPVSAPIPASCDDSEAVSEENPASSGDAEAARGDIPAVSDECTPPSDDCTPVNGDCTTSSDDCTPSSRSARALRAGPIACAYRSITITTNDPEITCGLRRGFAAVDSADAGPIFALTTNTRCVTGSSPMFRPPGAVWMFCTT
jgi:hypothetical protein